MSSQDTTHLIRKIYISLLPRCILEYVNFKYDESVASILHKFHLNIIVVKIIGLVFV